MRILITGANGMVARAAANYCRGIGDRVSALTRMELDISDAASIQRALAEASPEALINCAAYTEVDGAEAEPESSYAANSAGVENLARAAAVRGCTFVTISTDYVFDGTKDGFYTPEDVPRPQGVYAASKYEGEIRAAAANPASVIVRTGWIYGPGGRNFLSVMHRLLGEGKKIKAIRDSYGTPTYAVDLAVRLRELAGLKLPGIFHATNAGPGTSYLGFAEAVCEIGGFDPNLIEPVSNAGLERPAPRPVNSRLACTRSGAAGLAPLPDWRSALRRFLESEKAEAAA